MKGVSIVICTFNGISRIGNTIQSVIEQKLSTSFDFELIIVDNGSSDGTADFCEKYLSSIKHHISYRIEVERRTGLSYARAHGVRMALYDWVLFCDDDNYLFSNYLEVGYRFLEDNPAAGALGGQGIAKLEGTEPEWFRTYNHSYAVGPQSNFDGPIQSPKAELYGAGTFFKRNYFIDLINKGFESVMSDRKGKQLVSGGDVEWCYLLQLSGYKICYLAGLKFYHLIPTSRLSWSYYLKLKAGIALGAARLISYEPFFKTSNSNRFSFIKLYFANLTKCILSMIAFEMRLLFKITDRNNQINELSRVMIRSKVKSYLCSFNVSYKHYKRLCFFLPKK